MRLEETTEQRELRTAVRRFLAEKSSSTSVREVMETVEGYDTAVWKQVSTQLGLPAIAIPERFGGAGSTEVEQSIVLEEMGGALYCGPYFASVVLAANALLLSADASAQRDYLPAIASGELIATLAFTESRDDWAREEFGMLARRRDGQWLLGGQKDLVLDGHNAGLVLVVAQAPGGPSLFAVPGAATGLVADMLPTLDQTRRLARLRFTQVPGRLVGVEGGALDVLAQVLDRAAVALAAEQLGGAQAALDMAVDYAKTREQFGRPIGSFQAIKHRCADLLLEVESTRSALRYGAGAAAESAPDLPSVACLLKAYASETFCHAAAENIQIHGGIGFTWEHDAHLYFKRANFCRSFLGDPDYHRERLARRIGL